MSYPKRKPGRLSNADHDRLLAQVIDLTKLPQLNEAGGPASAAPTSTAAGPSPVEVELALVRSEDSWSGDTDDMLPPPPPEDPMPHELAPADPVPSLISAGRPDRPTQDRSAAAWLPLKALQSELVLPEAFLQRAPIGGIVDHARSRLGVAADLPAVMALGALATAVGGKFETRVDETWSVLSTLYSLIAAPPSARKTPTYDIIYAPIVRANQELIEQSTSRSQHSRRKVELDFLQRQYSGLLRDAARLGDDVDLTRAEQLYEAIQELIDHRPPALIHDDLTPEALAQVLDTQGGRAAICGDEAGTLETLVSGRYSKGGPPNLDALLKAYEGSAISVTRATKPPVVIARARLNINLAAQPQMLAELVSNQAARGRGVYQRFLLVNVHGCPAAVTSGSSSAADRAWQHTLDRLIALPTSPGAVPTVSMTEDAAALVLEVSRQYRRDSERVSVVFGGWIAKQGARLVRVAGLLHAGEHAGSPQEQWPAIPRSTVETALLLEEYWRAHAGRILDQRSGCPAELILNWARRHDRTGFTKKDIVDSLRKNAGLGTAAEVQSALHHLVACGYIRARERERNGSTGALPLPGYEVRPGLFDDL